VKYHILIFGFTRAFPLHRMEAFVVGARKHIKKIIAKSMRSGLYVFLFLCVMIFLQGPETPVTFFVGYFA